VEFMVDTTTAASGTAVLDVSKKAGEKEVASHHGSAGELGDVNEDAV
jgi:hypothetical protein